MANQWVPPYYGGPTSPTGSTSPPPNGSQQRLALDNLIRRELKVADPGDPNQVAQALLARYSEDPRAQAINQEAQGLPFLLSVPLQAPASPVATSSDVELRQATSDVDKGIQDLTTSPLLKDIAPELQGWADAVRSAITGG